MNPMNRCKRVNSAAGSTLLTDAPTGRHFAQFTAIPKAKIVVATRSPSRALVFVEAGLRRETAS